MNTRLQVEHPISEMVRAYICVCVFIVFFVPKLIADTIKVTGVDIVEHMIYVGAGRRLSLKQVIQAQYIVFQKICFCETKQKKKRRVI